MNVGCSHDKYAIVRQVPGDMKKQPSRILQMFDDFDGGDESELAIAKTEIWRRIEVSF